MALLFILLVIAGGMGLSVEAGLLGPLASRGGSVGNHEHLWDWRSVNLFLMLFFSPRSSPSFFSLPGWQLTGGLLGAGYVVILTMATPVIGIAMTMIGIWRVRWRKARRSTITGYSAAHGAKSIRGAPWR